MTELRRFALLLFATLGFAAGARAGAYDDHRDVFTPGYFLDERKFDGEAHRYYHDYALEKAYGVTPSISPYAAILPTESPIALLNWTNYNSVVFTVKNTGRYVDSWNFYVHETSQTSRSYFRGSVTGYPKSYAVTYSYLASLPNKPERVDVIPLLKMISYTLDYDANGGTWSAQPEGTTEIWSNAVTVASADSLSEREGYTYQGWNTQADGSGLAFAPDQILNDPSGGSAFKVDDNGTNIVLYAHWKPNDYTLRLCPSNGIDRIYYKAQSSSSSSCEWKFTSTPLDVLVAYGSTWQAYATAKTGYTYTAYTEKKPISGKMGLDGAEYAPVADANEITVTYNGNGKTSGSMGDGRFTYDQPGTLADNGYVRSYRVTYNVNGSGASVSPASDTATYAFDGWNDLADGTGEFSYADRAVVSNICGSTGGSVTLYAQWTPGSVTLPAPERTGAAFLGWYADKACTFKVGEAGDAYTPTANTTLYAKWRVDTSELRFVFSAGIARIYYRLGDATAWTPVAADSNVSVAYGVKWAAYAVAQPGYVHTATARSRPMNGTMGEMPSTFAPQATANAITLTYQGNGATSGQTASSKSSYDEPGVLSDNGFVRTYRVSFNANGSGGSVQPASAVASYAFAGWNTLADGSGIAYSNQQTVVNLSTGGGVTLYAQWTPGSVILPEPVCAGHAFDGWYSESDCTFKVGDAGDAYTPTENTTLYAKWDTLDYTLSIVPGKGIGKVYYSVDADETSASTWLSTTTSTNILLGYGAKWCAYAVAKDGYTYTETSAERPKSGTMGVEGALFAPQAKANTIAVTYVGNGSTSGSTSSSSFTYDTPGVLSDNGFVRTYRVSFNANGSGGSVQPASAEASYAFAGWNTLADGTGVAYSNQQTVVNLSTGAGVRLYAQWTPGSVILPEPERVGYAFDGWYSESVCTSKVGDAGDAYTPTADTTLYAKWNIRSYTVVFVDKSGKQTNRLESVTYGGSATPPIAPARQGESFSSWSSSDYKHVTEDCVIQAQYEAVKYHVTYHSNYRDPKLSDREVLSVGCGPHAEYSDRITLLDVGSKDLGFAKPGYTFLGWAWAADAVAVDLEGGTTLAWNQIADRLTVTSGENQAADLYAVWEPITYTLRFEPGLATGEPLEQTLVHDQPARLFANPYTLDNQRFLGWSVRSSTSTLDFDFLPDQALVTNLTATLTAIWDGNGDHTVLFDGNGATNVAAYTQSFVGTAAQRLFSNEFTRVGYEFAGWKTNFVTVVTNIDAAATNEIVVTNWSGVVYQDRELYRFAENASRYSTNTLYASWEPKHYTVIFNTGTNGVTRTMEPLVVFATNQTLTINNKYKYKSDRTGEDLVGWTRVQGSQKAEFQAYWGQSTIHATNLVDAAGNGVTLYAVWKGLGDLSQAAGLTNAILESSSWETGSEGGTNYVGLTQTRRGTYTMTSTVIGPGTFSYAWYWEKSGGNVTVKVSNDKDVKEDSLKISDVWQTRTFEVATTGECTVAWTCTIVSGPTTNDLRIKDMTWTPRDQEQVSWPTYTLTYANTKGAYLPASLPKTYAVTNETFAFERLEDVEGYEFDYWWPSNIVKNTTGNITVEARWKKIPVTCDVTFDLAGGTRTGGGELLQKVEKGFDAEAPLVAPSAGLSFAGWDKAFTNVTSDLAVTAQYEPIAYRIDYENTRDVVNTNWLGFTIDDLPVTIGPLADTRTAAFAGWEDASGAPGGRALPSGRTLEIPEGWTNNVILYAAWKDRVWYTHTYELGEHLARIGGGALVQTVEKEGDLQTPTIQADEGYGISWTGSVTNGTDVTISFVATANVYQITMVAVDDTTTVYRAYGTSLATCAPEKAGWICTGYAGSGCVPASGTATELVFTVTGPGEIKWLYEESAAAPQTQTLALVRSALPSASSPAFALVAVGASADEPDGTTRVIGGATNYFVSVEADEGGSVSVLDPAGGICASTAFWAPSGVVLRVTAKADPGWRFAGWECGADGVRVLPDAEGRITVEGPVALRAVFAKVFTVTFDLGAHLVQTGATMLVQSVVSNAFATVPGFIVDEGCTFNGWRIGGANGTFASTEADFRVVGDTTYVADVTVSTHALTLGTDTVKAAYGESVTATAPFDEITVGGTNLVCVGFAGTGNVPSSGSSTQVTFTVTGAGSLSWLYETNYWVDVQAVGGGSVSVLDPVGGICASTAFWAPAGAELTAVAHPTREEGLRGWYEVVGGSLVPIETEDPAALPLTVDGPLQIEARFGKPLYKVGFELGEHIRRTGGGALEQSVEEGSCAVPPTVVADEGWSFAGWCDAEGSLVDASTLPILRETTFSSVATAVLHTVRFILDAHLVRTGGGALEQSVAHGSAATLPTVKAGAKYAFAGWYGSDGNPVDATSLGVIASDLIVYGRERQVTFDVSVSVASGEENRGTVSGSRSGLKPGTSVTVKAVAKRGFVFAGWYACPTPTDACALSQAASYTFVMPAADCAYEARFIATVEDWATVSVGESADEYAKGQPIEPIAVTASGGSLPTLKATGLPSGLKFTAKDVYDSRTKELVAPANTIYGTPSRSGIYTATVTATTAGKATASTNVAFVVIDRAKGERVVRTTVSAINETVPGKTTGQGVYAAGKKVTLKATALKGYVFSGWWRENALVSRLASYALVVPDDDVTYEARFVTAAADAASIRASVNGMELIVPDADETSSSTGQIVETNVSVGVYLEWPVAYDAASASTVAVSGLPSGLKFTAKPVTSRVTTTDESGKRVYVTVTNVPANTIYGIPTAASKTDRWGEVVPSQVKVTVTTAGRNKAIGVIALAVEALPAELVGTYVGGSTNEPVGSATVTLAKTGKISGKWISEGQTWTLAANGFDDVDAITRYTATVTAKCGKTSETLTLVFRVNELGYGVVDAIVPIASTEEPRLFSATFVPWKTDTDLKAVATAIRGEKFVVVFDADETSASTGAVTLAGTVGANGVVSVKGTFDVGAARPYAATVSSTLVPLDEDCSRFELFVYYPPKPAKNFEGYAKRLVVE